MISRMESSGPRRLGAPFGKSRSSGYALGNRQSPLRSEVAVTHLFLHYPILPTGAHVALQALPRRNADSGRDQGANRVTYAGSLSAIAFIAASRRAASASGFGREAEP